MLSKQVGKAEPINYSFHIKNFYYPNENKKREKKSARVLSRYMENDYEVRYSHQEALLGGDMFRIREIIVLIVDICKRNPMHIEETSIKITST